MLAAAFVIAFGAVVPDFYMAADDLLATGMMDEVSRSGKTGVLDKLHAVVFRAEGSGHFRPTQDFVYVLLYEIFGVDRWILATMLLYAACHFVSGWLISAIMRRLGCSRPVALVAALLFVLHPVLDENLASVQFGNNVPGLTAILGAAFLWLPTRTGRGVLRLTGAAALIVVAIGLGINLMVTGAVLLSLMTVAIARSRRSFATLLIRGGVIAAALGVGLLHRWLAYGALGTKHVSYQNIPNTYELRPFIGSLIDSSLLLLPSPMAHWTSLRNPPGIKWDDGSAPLFSLDGAIVLATAIGLCAVVAFLLRGGSRDSGEQRAPRLAPSFWFGVALWFAMLLPYFAFIGRVSPHRYMYPSEAGLAVIVATSGAAAGRLLARVMPAPIVAGIGGVLLAFIFASLVRVDREAARSMASGHRVTRTIVSALASDLAADPEVRHLFVIGYPRMIGRAGHSIVFPEHLRQVLNAKLGQRFTEEDSEFHQALLSGRITIPLPKDAALFLVSPDGTTVTRVRSGEEHLLPDYARLEGYAAIGRAWKLEEDPEALAGLLSPDFVILEATLRIIIDAESLHRAHLLRSAGARSGGSARMKLAALDLARRDGPAGRALAARIAVFSRSDEIEQAAFDVMAAGNAQFTLAKAREALAREREAQEISRKPGASLDALKALQAAQSAWVEAGVPRDDLYDSISFNKIADLDESGLAEARRIWVSKKWGRLVKTLDAVRESRKRDSIPGFSLELWPLELSIPRAPHSIPLEVVIVNESSLYVPGAVSSLSGRLDFTLVWPDGKESPAGDLWLPPEGVESDTKTPVVVSVDVPVSARPAALRIEFFAYGKRCAVAHWPLPATGKLVAGAR